MDGVQWRTALQLTTCRDLVARAQEQRSSRDVALLSCRSTAKTSVFYIRAALFCRHQDRRPKMNMMVRHRPANALIVHHLRCLYNVSRSLRDQLQLLSRKTMMPFWLQLKKL